MILFESAGPNPHVVNLFIAEKGISIKRRTIDIVAGENRNPDYQAINLTATTPALVLDSGETISETVAICEYLEEIAPDPVLIGATPEQRANTRMWVRRIDLCVTEPMSLGFRAAEGRQLFEPRVRVMPADSAPSLKAMAQDGLRLIDAALDGRDWIAGHGFSLADIILFAFLEFGRQVGQPVSSDLSQIDGWLKRAAMRLMPTS